MGKTTYQLVQDVFPSAVLPKDAISCSRSPHDQASCFFKENVDAILLTEVPHFEAHVAWKIRRFFGRCIENLEP